MPSFLSNLWILNIVNFHLKKKVCAITKRGWRFFSSSCFHLQLLLVCCCGKFNKFETFSIGKHIIVINFRPATSSMILISLFLLPYKFYFLNDFFFIFCRRIVENWGMLRMLLLLCNCGKMRIKMNEFWIKLGGF